MPEYYRALPRFRAPEKKLYAVGTDIVAVYSNGRQGARFHIITKPVGQPAVYTSFKAASTYAKAMGRMHPDIAYRVVPFNGMDGG